MRRVPYCCTLLLVSAAAHASLYTCIDAQGNKTVSDKACPAAQSTGKVYPVPPPRPAAPTAPAIDPQALTPQTADELKAMLQVRERAARGLPPEGAEEAPPAAPRETDAQRHMRLYLEQRRQEAPPAADSEDEDSDAERIREQESARRQRCANLRERSAQLDQSSREQHSASAGEQLHQQKRNVQAQMAEGQCGG